MQIFRRAGKRAASRLPILSVLYVVGFAWYFFFVLWGTNDLTSHPHSPPRVDLVKSEDASQTIEQKKTLERRVNTNKALGDKDDVKDSIVESRTDTSTQTSVQARKTDKDSKTIDIKQDVSSDKATAERAKVHSVDMQRSVLMVVAHPDDDVLWGGEYLLEAGHKTHVVVTSTRNRHTSERFEEFTAVQKHLGTHGEFLDGKDSPSITELESHIKARIQNLICSKDWERIITHGPEGEYGHPQHLLVHDAVLDAVRVCGTSADKLYVFQPYPDKEHVFSEAKSDVAKLYKSQAAVIFKTFKRWREQIVPLKDYDYKSASETCRAHKGVTELYRQCRLHKLLDFSDPDYRTKISFGMFLDQGVDSNKQEVIPEPTNINDTTQELSRKLETPCGVDEAPIFVTFAVTTEKGRWSFNDGARALRILYSSLVRSHGCAVQLNVHTNMPPTEAQKSYILSGSQGKTTMGTEMTGLVFHELNESYLKNPYNDKNIVPHANMWFALSRAKLDTFEEYLGSNQQPVWIDLDTVVFDRVAVNAPVPWVYGYHHGSQRRNTCFGDIFSLDQETVQDIRRMENELLEGIQNGNGTALPKYDLQGYFEIILDRQQEETSASTGVSTKDNTGSRKMLHVVQEGSPDFSFGFDCADRKHPKPDKLKDGVKAWEESSSAGKRLKCKNFKKEDAKVASMSFTASSYKLFFMGSNDDTRFDIINDQEARNLLNDFFYNLTATVPQG